LPTKTSYYSLFSHKSIVRDLLLWLILLVLVTAGVTATGYIFYAKKSACVEMHERADVLASELSSMLSVPLYNVDYDSVQHISKIFLRIPDIIGVYVEDEQGKTIFDTIAKKDSGLLREVNILDEKLYLGRIRILLSSNFHEKHQQQTLITILLVGLLLILVLVSGIRTIMEIILIRPLGRFNKGLLQIADGNYSTLLKPFKHNDLNDSVNAVNSMATKIEKTIDEVSRTRDFLQNILDSMPSVLIVVNRDGRISNLNLSAATLAPPHEKSIKGKPVAEIFPLLGNDIDKHVSKAITQGKTVIIGQRKCPSFGKKKSAEVTIFPLSASVADGAVIRIDDITSRVRLQEVMVHTEKMLSVGGLGAGMAHEINNPLGGILQAAQNVERRLSPELQKNVEVANDCGFQMASLVRYLEERQILRMINGIRESGLRAAKIVQNMLQFSRHNDSAMESCVVAEMLDRVIELARNDFDLKRKYDFKNYNVIRNYRRDVKICCSRTGVEQVFLNLIKNAAQACAPISESNNTKPEITINASEDEDAVSVEISDNGHGMSEDTQKRIFEPFFTTKKVGEGTGLGLAVSYFIIVDQHKGHLSVDSIPGEGASFTVNLPKL
jgi:PAS domain S-box-containing protein